MIVEAFDSIVVRTTCKLLVPFVQVFALYVLFHGHESPGGGFQGGAILGASIILLRFTTSRDISRRYLSGSVAIRVGALGVLVYGTVGLLPMLFGAEFLNYGAIPVPFLSTPMTRAMGILAVEIGVALGVTGVMVSIFDDLAPNPPDEEEAEKEAA